MYQINNLYTLNLLNAMSDCISQQTWEKTKITKICIYVYAKSESEVAQSRPALLNPMDCGLPRHTLSVSFPTEVPRMVTIPLSEIFQLGAQTRVSAFAGRALAALEPRRAPYACIYHIYIYVRSC